MADYPCQTRAPDCNSLRGSPDSPKFEAKGVILVRGPWDETSGSPDLPFFVNRSTSFLSV